MRFYFICHPQGPPERAAYQHCLVALAEGLTGLGFAVHGNLDYWEKRPSSGDYLIRREEGIDHNDCDVVLLGSTLYDYPRPDLIPADLFRRNRRYRLIFIDNSDGRVTPGFLPALRDADLVLKTHFCRKHNYPENFVPWQFGPTERMIEAVRPIPYSERENKILVNYRYKHHLRSLADEAILPLLYPILAKEDTMEPCEESVNETALDRHFWRLTGCRHYTEYFKRLGRQKACASFGGYLEDSSSPAGGSGKKSPARIRRETALSKFDCIYQFDSWRFWESMLSACATLHVDFDAYGAVFPVMPENGREYLGIDFSKPHETRERLLSPESFEAIGERARSWSLDHYSPVPVARRLLSMLDLRDSPGI